MGCLLPFLLIALPPLAIWINHEVVQLILIFAWTVLVVPMCILWVIDYVRNDMGEKRSPFLLTVLKVPIALFGLLSLMMGGSIVLWCLYNVFVQRLPEYSGPQDWLSLVFEGCGVGFPLLSFGGYLMLLAFSRYREPESDEKDETGAALTSHGEEPSISRWQKCLPPLRQCFQDKRSGNVLDHVSSSGWSARYR